MAVTAVIASAVIAGGTAYHSSRSSKRAASDAGRDQENAIKDENRRLDDEKAKVDAGQAIRAQRARQKALLASGGGYGSTIHTSPLGLSSNAPGKSKLGD